MRTTRIYVDLELSPDQALLLPATSSAHVLRVLRLRVGAALTVFNGRGGEFAATLIGTEKSAARLHIGAHGPVERESTLHLTLLQGIARGERMDFIVQKATELGVQRIVPLACEFSVVRLDPAAQIRRVDHWRNIAIAACEQCGRNRLPVINTITAFTDWCVAAEAGTAITAGCGGELRLMLVPEALDSLSTLTADNALTKGRLANAVLLIGPEGGLSKHEQPLAQRCGFRACRLGPRILRTETAPLAALAALQALAGDLG